MSSEPEPTLAQYVREEISKNYSQPGQGISPPVEISTVDTSTPNETVTLIDILKQLHKINQRTKKVMKRVEKLEKVPKRRKEEYSDEDDYEYGPEYRAEEPEFKHVTDTDINLEYSDAVNDAIKQITSCYYIDSYYGCAFIGKLVKKQVHSIKHPSPDTAMSYYEENKEKEFFVLVKLDWTELFVQFIENQKIDVPIMNANIPVIKIKAKQQILEELRNL